MNKYNKITRPESKETIDEFAQCHHLRITRDTDKTLIIRGKGRSHIYKPAEGWLAVIYLPSPSRGAQSWSRIRSRLVAAGMTILQNGYGEGTAEFDPHNKVQARLAIEVAGIRRRRVFSAAQLEARARGLAAMHARRIQQQSISAS